MHYWKFIIAVLLTSIWIWIIDRPYGQIPPPASFFSPFEGFWQNAESTERLTPYLPERPKGLKSPVQVFFDERRVPHVFAENNHDLSFMQGYLTAAERLWQMDFQVRAASGRIAEIVGPVALDFDRVNRRKGIAYGARNFAESLKDDDLSMEIVTAYTNGVNAYINQLSYRNYPLEFKLLNYAPEEWSVYKTALLLKYMADMLAGHDNDFAHTKALQHLGRDIFDQLYPDYISDLSPIAQFEDDKTFSIPEIDTPELNPVFSGGYRAELPPGPDRVLGSNNWALGPERTASGVPILSNDPHLALNLPSIWYEMQLYSPDMNVYGVTLPGSPGIIIGFNEFISWGVTNSGLDVRDWYKIHFRDERKMEYLLDGEWKPVTLQVESIFVKNEGVFLDTVRYTSWGPVTFDQSFHQHPDFVDFACRWTAHEPSMEHLTFYYLNQGKNLTDYLEALKFYETPGQNFVFASRFGDIAITHQGKFPARWPEQGKFLMDGSSSDYKWQAFIPQEDLPREINPERGFVSSANQHPTDSLYPYFYTAYMLESFRNRRINNLLEETTNATLEDMRKMQFDNFNMMAAELVPVVTEVLKSQSVEDVQTEKWLTALEEWDFYNEPEYAAPAFFEIFHDTLEIMLYAGLKERDPAIAYPNQFVKRELIEQYRDTLWVIALADGSRKFTEMIIRDAFQDAVNQIEFWETNHGKQADWATFKATRLAHLAMIEAFYVRDLPIGGNKHIVNATSRTHGPSWKMVVEMLDWPRAIGIYPGGQSGNPGSKFYANFAMDWAKGEMYELLFLSSPDDELTGEMLELRFK